MTDSELGIRPRFVPTPFLDRVDEGRIILRDGSLATVRVAQPQDSAALQQFFAGLSPHSKQRRFFSQAVPHSTLVEKLCDSSDPRTVLTLIVTQHPAGTEQIIGTGSYIARDSTTAEVAFTVDDAFHGRGLGTILLERLALLALRNGLTRFWAMTSSENRQMLDVFRDSGFAAQFRLEQGYVEVDLSVVPTSPSVTFADMRDRIATQASLHPFFEPKAVAIVGASRSPSNIGRRVLDSLIANGYSGALYPVNRQADDIAGLPCYPSVREIPSPVELAVIAVNRKTVLSVVDDCAARHVKALIVITAGFAEVGSEGRHRQRALVEKARGYGMRLVGPNCLGLINTDPKVRLSASFAPTFPPAGSVAMLSQSGALGIAVLALSAQRDLGLSGFVSVGNKADVSSNDLLQYWEDDPRTNTILLYLESFGNPRRFARIARRVGRRKPIVTLKSGRRGAGSRAAGSHTAALATNDTAVDAMFLQTGVIRAETLEEMFDIGMCLSTQPLPCGRRVGIVTNAGGPGILCADACEAASLIVPEFTPDTRSRLAAFLPPVASLENPVDMIASASPDHYRLAVETLLNAKEIDALVVIYTPVTAEISDAVESAILQAVTAARNTGVTQMPVLACVMFQRLRPLSSEQVRIPSYDFPELAARALAKIADYSTWRERPEGMVPDFDNVRPAVARDVVRGALRDRGAGWLTPEETRTMLESYGLPVSSGGVARTPEQAVELARALGFPVALKLASRQVVHKTELGVVRLNLADEEAVRTAFNAIRDRVAGSHDPGAMDGVLVQPMLSGVELMVGVTHDPLFGPLVAFGLGGIHVEILRDIVFRITPLTDRDASDMISGIRGFPLLRGYRGHAPADLGSIADVLLRVSRLAEDVSEVVELDLNPIFAMPPGSGCRIADARIQIGTA